MSNILIYGDAAALSFGIASSISYSNVPSLIFSTINVFNTSSDIGIFE